MEDKPDEGKQPDGKQYECPSSGLGFVSGIRQRLCPTRSPAICSPEQDLREEHQGPQQEREPQPPEAEAEEQQGPRQQEEAQLPKAEVEEPAQKLAGEAPRAEEVEGAAVPQELAEPEGTPLDLGCFPLQLERPQPRYNLFCVVDFECTCDEVNEHPHEIIEFPAIFVNAQTLRVEFEFHQFVRPTERPQLSNFCTGLTGIQQDQVDAASPLEDVLLDFEAFLRQRGLVPQTGRHVPEGSRSFCVATDGRWDVQKFLEPECLRKGIVGFGKTWRKVVNVRRLFHNHFGLQGGGVRDMLASANLDFQGREHSGIADSRNIARLLALLLADGVDVQHNLVMQLLR